MVLLTRAEGVSPFPYLAAKGVRDRVSARNRTLSPLTVLGPNRGRPASGRRGEAVANGRLIGVGQEGSNCGKVGMVPENWTGPQVDLHSVDKEIRRSLGWCRGWQASRPTRMRSSQALERHTGSPARSCLRSSIQRRPRTFLPS